MPSRWVNSSCVVRHLGRMRHSKPHMLKSKLGLSLLYTDTKLFSHSVVVTDRGRRFFMSQNTARPLQHIITIQLHWLVKFNVVSNKFNVISNTDDYCYVIKNVLIRMVFIKLTGSMTTSPLLFPTIKLVMLYFVYTNSRAKKLILI